MRYFSHISIVLLAVMVLTAFKFPGCSDGIIDVPPGDDAAEHTYEVTIKNLTDGQPLSPGAFATHTKRTHFFKVGETASEGLRLIAEEGNPETAVNELNANRRTHDVVASSTGIPPGEMITIQIEGRANANRLSGAVMLVCTNDGFTGLKSIKLPGGYKADTYEVNGYDAGTEANEETSESIVDGCGLGMDGNSRMATSDPIMHHPGIQGGADLDPADHGWTDPVARITVRRMR